MNLSTRLTDRRDGRHLRLGQLEVEDVGIRATPPRVAGLRQWDGTELTGWIATSPNSPKAKHLAKVSAISLTYWSPNQDTCTADCTTSWDDTPDGRQAGWDRFLHAPEPVGYDPRVVPQWTSPEAPEFGILRLRPRSLRVMPGTVMSGGPGELLIWKG